MISQRTIAGLERQAFASALVKNLPTPGLEVRRLFDFVRDDVMEATGRKQKPFSYGSISGRQDFYFVNAPTAHL